MRKLPFLLISLSAIVAVPRALAQPATPAMLLISGGTFRSTKSNYSGKSVAVADFYLGKYEVTQREWKEVMGTNPSHFVGDELPVENVSWYDCVDYCNQRSLHEGLTPYYQVQRGKTDPNNHTAVDPLKWTVTINAGANGYRLPTEVEWEYAATGGQSSGDFNFSGGHELDRVGWFWANAGDEPQTGSWSWPAIERNHTRTHPVGQKAPNELGLYDMSGNVREWCWDWLGELRDDGAGAPGSTEESGRVWKGGGWIGGDFCCAPAFRASFEASGRGPDQGLRLCRSK